jgi:hypothetical protein
VASIDVDLVFVHARAHVGSGGRSADCGGAVVQVGFCLFTDSAELGVLLDVPPRVIETSSGIVMTSEDKYAVSLNGVDRDMLGSSRWKVSVDFNVLPVTLIFVNV